MKLIALNLTEPKPYALGNRNGETGIFQTPVLLGVETTLNGLVGNTQVDTEDILGERIIHLQSRRCLPPASSQSDLATPTLY